MKILIFGATGMVGQGVLRASLQATDVTLVRCIGRTPLDNRHPKLDEVIHAGLFNYDAIEDKLTGFDACFFCLGVSSSGLNEEKYTRLTYDLTVAVATVLAKLNPGMVFTYVSGSGTDSTAHGKSMWARVKGRTENALLHLPFAGAYMFRPGAIQPLDGISSKTRSYRLFYSLAKPILPLMRRLMPNTILTTTEVGNAMLNAARKGNGRRVLEIIDIKKLAG